MLTACSVNTSSRLNLVPLAAQNGFLLQEIKASPFVLTSYTKFSNNPILTIFIEGDGFAWKNRHKPSRNPTPKNNVMFNFAKNSIYENKAYLARPCQFTNVNKNPACKNFKYWTSHRFSQEVINAMSKTIDILKNKAGADKVRLVGYSGGGAVAVLVASLRGDISEIITIAGNLNTEMVNNIHRVSSMPNSLNPVDFAKNISHIPQLHIASEADKIIPPKIVKNYKLISGSNCVNLVILNNPTHYVGWGEAQKYHSRPCL